MRPNLLTTNSFAPFGSVVEADPNNHILINQGTAKRFYDLAPIDVAEDGGTPCISLFQAEPWPQPITIKMLERHPLGSQMFYPLSQRPFLVVVAKGKDKPDLSTIKLLLTSGRQGVNIGRNVWHHPLLVMKPDASHSHRTTQEFLVIDRMGPGKNIEEFQLDKADEITIDL